MFYNKIKKIYKIKRLLKNNSNIKVTFNTIYYKKSFNVNYGMESLKFYNIFGKSIDLNKINWHKDYISNYIFPFKRFDQLQIEKWFDKGIDIKFPWEVSRFYFVVNLAQNYLISNDKKYYLQFKKLVLDWIEKNPYCFGVNWVCTMEAAIRAINWIVAVNIFGNVFEKDENFKKIFNKSLVQHAEYISAFPEIRKEGHTTNHTTSDYVGLLFLALTLKEHQKYKKWLNQAKEGLLRCMEYQVYNDGVDFEGSIPYHRLVLEMFAYSAIVCRANDIEFSNRYYELLFKMFEYTAAYMDYNGNAPQVGDNDSGRILIFHKSVEHDHSYLLDLGEHIFDYKFKSQCKKRNSEFKQWLPEIEKIKIDKFNIVPRETNKSISFKKGGAYFLKNDNFSLMVSCFPLGQNGKGGHNHLDMGSFTLSYKGQPIIVDPGTYTYTKDFEERNNFRNLTSHNLLLTEKDKESINLNELGIWELKEIFKTKLLEFNNNMIRIEIINILTAEKRERKFIINKNNLILEDKVDNYFYQYFHLGKIKINRMKGKKINLDTHINFFADNKMELLKYAYSTSYGLIEEREMIKIYCKCKNEITIELL